MNFAISEACKQASDAEKGKIEIRPAIPFVPESTVESDRIDKNKDEFISVTCRYRPSVQLRGWTGTYVDCWTIETGSLRWHFFRIFLIFSPTILFK